MATRARLKKSVKPGDRADVSREGYLDRAFRESKLHQDDKELFKKHWTDDLDQWFEQGIDTPGLTLIEVAASRAECWGKPGDGVVELCGGGLRKTSGKTAGAPVCPSGR